MEKFENLPLTMLNNKEHKTTISVGNINVGHDFLKIAGPCSVESKEQIEEIAYEVKKYGANVLRGGLYKPRSSPYSFQGLKEDGLILLQEAGKKANLLTITEVVDAKDIDIVSKYVDILQIGAR
ncbi:MAG: hypothetical protein WBO70_07660, partial [Erysipelotrichaceae bacterium]